MHFVKPLERWEFNRREKRFFIYGQTEGQVAHCPNTGSMKTVLDAARYVWVSARPPSPTRTLNYTAELAELPNGTMALINTGHANTLAGEALRAGQVPGLGPVHNLRPEVKFSAETRFDWAYEDAQGRPVWVEVKNVTLAEGEMAAFPDAVSTRGTKHLNTLAEIVRGGGQAVQIYVVARTGVTAFRPAAEIDPTYAAALHAAHGAGVKVVALGCTITPHKIDICQTLPIVL